MSTIRIAPAVPIYRPQNKREQRIVNTSTKINSLPIKSEAEVVFDARYDFANMVITCGLGIACLGLFLALLIHNLGWLGLAIFLTGGVSLFFGWLAWTEE